MDGLDKYTTDDRFELLSAYVDDEVSIAERKLVESWIDTDPQIRHQYRALASLTRSFQALPTETSSVSVDDTLDAVLKRVEHRPQRLKLAGIGAALAALVGGIGALFVGNLSPQMAFKGSEVKPQSEISATPNQPTQESQGTNDDPVETDSLMLALEAPPVDIPVVSSEF